MEDSLEPTVLRGDRLRREIQRRGGDLLAVLPDNVHILDADGLLVAMSDSFGRSLGFGREELLGRHVSFWDIGQPASDLTSLIRERLSGTAGTASPGGSETPPVETLYRGKDGLLFPAEVRYLPIRIGEDRLLYGSSRNISERRRRAERTFLTTRLSRLTVFCDRILSGTADLAPLLQKICDEATQAAAMDLAWIETVEGSSPGVLRACSRKGGLPGPDPPGAKELFSTTEGTGPFFLEKGDDLPEGLWKDWSRREGILSGAVLPIFREDRLWGLFALFEGRSLSFDPELRALYEELARTLSRGLDNRDIRTRQALLSNALAAVGEGVLITDARQQVLFTNNAFTAITGFSPEEMAGKNCRLLQGPETDSKTAGQIRDAIREGRLFQGEILNYKKDGTPFWNLLSINPVRNADGTLVNFVGVQRDITPLVMLTRRLEYDSRHDRLTDLPNRRGLDEHLERAVARARRNGTRLAVGMIDLDDFKPVNDTLGHEAGDRLLRELSQRLQGLLRASDFLARVGGDEFVVVIQDLPANSEMAQIGAVLDRLHTAADRPFGLTPGQEIRVEMSLGLALFPSDAQTPDALLRQADAAMYQSKSDKHRRISWWRRGSLPFPSEENEPFDPYGTEAATLLELHRERFDAIIDRFLNQFYGALSQSPDKRSILEGLDAEELALLREHQRRHLTFLLGPNTTSDAIRETGERIGEIHTLSGVTGAMLLDAESLYTRLLIDSMNEALLSSRDRYRIVLISEARLQEDIQAQLKREATTVDSYMSLLPSPLPRRGTLWRDCLRRELESMERLPGLRALLFLRPDSHGRFLIQESGGAEGKSLSEALMALQYDIFLSPEGETADSFDRKTLLARSWHDQRITDIPSLARETEDPWRSLWQQSGLRSLIAIPVGSATGQPVGVLLLGGAYPSQFSSSWMQQFVRSLRQRWEQVWTLSNAPATVLDEVSATNYRRLLFSGGLTMLMQPVVDLRSGRLVKVEALARLRLPDGTIVLPDIFLPLLGEAELDRLFRIGLDMALKSLGRWTEAGLGDVGVSVNIAPSTLLLPECPVWVAETLAHHGIDPGRLTLEILETQVLDHQNQEEAVRRLVSLGVILAMDDLGSGYSSLQRLSSLPFDNVKVDYGLLSRIRIIPLETLGMIGAIVQMGREFGHEVVIEGLEDDGMIEAATFLGAHLGQGFKLARPMDPDRIPDWSRNARDPARPESLRSWLGALAYHWKFMHSETPRPHPEPFDRCPLTRFLREKESDGEEGAVLHQALHQPEADLFTLSRSLTLWLAERVRREDPTPDLAPPEP